MPCQLMRHRLILQESFEVALHLLALHSCGKPPQAIIEPYVWFISEWFAIYGCVGDTTPKLNGAVLARDFRPMCSFHLDWQR